MPAYEDYLALAKEHEITAFTALQDEAFQNSHIDDPEANLFVIGETSSGKTLIAELLYEKLLQDAQRAGAESPKMLFVVPYRALASQKKQEFDSFFAAYDLSIVQSTGEFRDRDRDVQLGNVDVAVIITEKAFRFQANDAGFLAKYDLIVLDEVGLINTEDRGIFCDFLLVWGTSLHSSTGRPRLVSLGTPFYDWDVYVSHYGFTAISTNGSRPVALENHTIIYSDNSLRRVDGTCGFLHPFLRVTPNTLEKNLQLPEPYATDCPKDGKPCPITDPCRVEPERPCGRIGATCVYPLLVSRGSVKRQILLQICEKHLLQGHQILIFINNRAEVVEISRFLYERLRQMTTLKDIFPEPPSAEECRREILTACGLNADDVYGILEYDGGPGLKMDCYQAIKSGIAFHSAALPNELRTYIEDRLLAGREMKIVCSTETLAFGVNSAVDVVVVASLVKQEGSMSRLITMNEYRNYAGRAGRLRPGNCSPGGTVYTLVRENQEEDWNRMREEPPPRLMSVFYSSIDEKLPFFLLNLIPNDGNGIRFEQLLGYAGLMPREGTEEEDDLEGHVREAVDFLVDNELLEKTVSRGRGRKAAGPTYLLTGIGGKMRGYILNRSDFTDLRSFVGEYVNSVFQEPDKVTFLYRLLSTKQAASALNSVFENSDTKLSWRELRDYIRGKSTGSDAAHWSYGKKDEKLLYVLGAVLAWCDGESARVIYTHFGVQYALLNRLTEQLSYLVEIGRCFIPDIVERKGRELSRRLEALSGRRQVAGFDRESIEMRCSELAAETHLLSASLYYGINADVHRELMDYLQSQGEEASELISRYRADSFDPATAKEFRNIVFAYSFFSGRTAQMPNTLEDRNNYLSRRRQQYLTIKNMRRPVLIRFFEERFGEAFTGDLNGGIAL